MVLAPTNTKHRFGMDGTVAILDDSRQTYGETTINNAQTVIMGNVINRFESEAAADPEFRAQSYDRLLKSLLFERFDFRVNNVKRPLMSTGEWLFRNESYLAWCDCHASSKPASNGFLWIKGKPGTGKSVLMKAAYERARRSYGGSVNRSIVPYFFNARAPTALEKSTLGLYRVLSHHLLIMDESLKERFIDRFNWKQPGKGGELWTSEELQDFIYESADCGKPWDLTLFIDALDEAGKMDEVRDMISFLFDLAERTTLSGRHAFKVCFLSRHFPHINIDRGMCIIVDQATAQQNDIATYINQKIMCADGNEKRKLSAAIRQKSNSIFLWVALVIPRINALDDEGASFDEMQAYLETVPPDLDDLFRQIIGPSLTIEETRLYFQIVLFACRALDPVDLYTAVKYCQPNLGPSSVPSGQKLNRHILHRCRGLTEIVTSSESKPFVQFIHETAREYLLGPAGLLTCHSSIDGNLPAASHNLMVNACARCLTSIPLPKSYQYYLDGRLTKTRMAMASIERHLSEAYPFLLYAAQFMFDHAATAESNGSSQTAFLEGQLDDQGRWAEPCQQWIDLLLWPHAIDVNRSLLLVLMREERHLVLSESILAIPRTRCDLNLRCRGFGPPLQEAIRWGSLSTTQALIQAGADINAHIDGSDDLLNTAAISGSSEIVSLLIDSGVVSPLGAVDLLFTNYGAYKRGTVATLMQAGVLSKNLPDGYNILHALAVDEWRSNNASKLNLQDLISDLILAGIDINSRTALGDTALLLATKRDKEALISALLEYSADPNAENSIGETALLVAVQKGNQTLIKQLTEAGAKDTGRSGQLESLIYMACREGIPDNLRIAVEAGVVLAGHSGLESNLMYDTIYGKGTEDSITSILQILIELGMKVNVRNESGFTPLFAASTLGYVSVVRLLLDSGAEPNEIFADGRRYSPALEEAFKNDHAEVVYWLNCAGAIFSVVDEQMDQT